MEGGGATQVRRFDDTASRAAIRRLLALAVLLAACAAFAELALSEAAQPDGSHDLLAAAGQAAGSIAVVLSDNSAICTEVADALRGVIEKEASGRLNIYVLSLSQFAEEGPRGYRTIVTVGVRAASQVGAPRLRTPVLHTLISRATFERLFPTPSASVSAIFRDQPPVRQLQLARLVSPFAARIGVVYGPESVAYAKALERAAKREKVRLEAETIRNRDELPQALAQVLARSDLLLALPDPEVHTDLTLHRILLSAYRADVPVIAFSAAYVRAGALAAVFSTSEQIGRQAGEMLLRPRLPPPQPPRYFTVEVNRNVAQAIGIQVPDDATLRDTLGNR